MSTLDFEQDFKQFFAPIFQKAFENVQSQVDACDSKEMVLTFNLFPHRELTLSESMHYSENIANYVNDIMVDLVKDTGLSILGVGVNKESHKVVIAVKKGELEHDSVESEEVNPNSEATDEGN
jgi:hypothetical protein